MNIAIIGTRGIPNHYGGFEQCAEYLALGLVQRGYKVTVYNSHNHPYTQIEWKGVKLIHCYDPEYKLGTAGQFIYDFNCIKDCRKRNYDIILQLGYTSSSLWGWMLPRKSVITTNMDGLEWKRTKFSSKVKKFLQYAEKLGVQYSDYLISDSIGIQDYLFDKYKKQSTYIPYGAHLFNSADEEVIEYYQLTAFQYSLLIARLEPENSIEIILDGVVKSQITQPFLVIGKHETQYGGYLKEKYRNHINIRFIGGIYNIDILNNLRHFSKLYFHGHTVGGTNPSLLEAMASNALICANKNAFNQYILNDDAYYFVDSDDVSLLISKKHRMEGVTNDFIENNRIKISQLYTWDIIVEKYSKHFEAIIKNQKNKLSPHL